MHRTGSQRKKHLVLSCVMSSSYFEVTGGSAGEGACCALYPLWLQVTLPAQHFTVPDLGFDEVLLGGRQEEAFGIHRSDDIVPNGTALAVITAHPSWEVLLYHLEKGSVGQASRSTQAKAGSGSRGFYLWRAPLTDYCVYFHLFPELQVLKEKRTGHSRIQRIHSGSAQRQSGALSGLTILRRQQVRDQLWTAVYTHMWQVCGEI